MILICCLLLVGPFYFMFYLVKCYLCIWVFFSLYCTATYVPYTPCLKFISAADGFRGWQTCFLIFLYVFVLLYSNFLCFSESFLSQNLVHCTAHLFGLIRKKMHTNLTQSSIALKGMLTSSLQMKRLFIHLSHWYVLSLFSLTIYVTTGESIGVLVGGFSVEMLHWNHCTLSVSL